MFAHLHCHTQYSLLDGHCNIKDLVSRAKVLCQPALAITDHGNMSGAIEFYNTCVKNGVKPIIGIELYTAPNAYEKEGQQRGHITLLAKNEVGYQNLMRMASFAATDGMYYKPRVDTNIMRKYHEGIICLSGCIQGDLQQALLRTEYKKAKQIAEEYRDIFGDDYYIELQYHGIADQKSILAPQITLARKLGIKLVATNDVHYVRRESAEAQTVMMCIGMKTTVQEAKYDFPPEFYLKSETEMRALFDKIAPDAIENTIEIANKCNLKIEQGKYLLPAFDVKGKDKASYFRALCNEGLKRRYGDAAATYSDRLDYEVSTIESMGFVDYFLIVCDIVAYARRNGITVGCRGSAGGSIVAYCLGISDIDPMRWGLQFERFLNPERVTMPDIDIDVDPEGREDLVNYLTTKYGSKRVCQIMTTGTEGAKYAVRDTGKALGLPDMDINRISGYIPTGSTLTLAECLKEYKDLQRAYDSEPQTKKLLDIAMQIEGTKRNAGIHAAAVIISPDDLTDHIPIKRNPDTNRLVSQYDMSAAEAVGMLKIDLLGLINLSTLNNAEKAIRKKNPEFKLSAIGLDDKSVYEMLGKGDTSGVFQLESDGMRDVMKKMQPSRFEDLVAAIALYRPGPMDNIPTYIEGKKNPGAIKYMHPVLEPILAETYGVPVYQEQVMSIVRDCAGYTMGRSDIVRRAMAKKKADVLEQEKVFFIHGKPAEKDQAAIPGCVERGISEDTAEALWAMMSRFAEYAFNKSHAASYARVAYQTAWLKVHYPLEYRCALLTSEIGRDGNRRLIRLIHDGTEHGISILPPNINSSETGFSVEGDNIRFGMSAIKDTGKAVLAELIMERTVNGPYKDFRDLIERTVNTCNKNTLTALIKSGALDSFPQTRDQMLAVLDNALKLARAARKKLSEERLQYEDSFFTMGESDAASDAFHLPEFDYPAPVGLAKSELYKMEMESTGLYITGHPIYDYADRIKGRTTNDIVDLLPDENGKSVPSGTSVRIAGIIVEAKARMTKAKKPMAQLTIEDSTGKISVTVFPRAYESYGDRLKTGTPILVFGKVDADSYGIKVICDSIAYLDDTPEAAATA